MEDFCFAVLGLEHDIQQKTKPKIKSLFIKKIWMSYIKFIYLFLWFNKIYIGILHHTDKRLCHAKHDMAAVSQANTAPSCTGLPDYDYCPAKVITR